MPSRLGSLIDRVKSPIRNGLIPGSSKSTLNGTSSRKSSTRKSTSSGATTPSPVSEIKASSAAIKEKKQLDKDEKRVRAEMDKMERDRLAQEEHDRDPARDRYGLIPHDGSPLNDEQEREDFRNIPKEVGHTVLFRARIQSIRPMSAKLAFIVFRQQLFTVQGVLRATDEEGDVSENMVRWAEKLPRETIVLVEGMVREAEKEVLSTEIHKFEMDVVKLHVLSEVTESPAWTVADAARPIDAMDEDNEALTNTGRIGGISLQSRLKHRAMDLRTPTNQAIFTIQARVCRYFREYLDERGFLEVHTAKLQPAATESGSSVFKVDYFQRAAFLAQSPQLAKETCISADFERVYEIGPVFRAENSNTHRHMTEFTGLDLEMAIEHSYLEARTVIDGLLKHVFRSLQTQNAEEIERVKRQFPHDDLVFPEETVILAFTDGIRLLQESGWTEEDGEEIDEYEDLSRPAEVRLGQLVKEKYNTDYYILDKFPAEVRPFYTMPDPSNPKLSNSFDIFLRGEEILSGGQRLHSAKELEARITAAGINPAEMADYLDAFRWGVPPHAGGGIGLERLVMLFLKLGNLRNASLFPRDPRSFPDAVPAAGIHIHNDVTLPHVDRVVGYDEETVASQDDMRLAGHPPLEDLIAKYGDSTNTAWTDPGYKVWRYEKTGAAIGYVDSHGHSVSWGYPLCTNEELPEVINAYIAWLKHQHLKPIWLNVNAHTEKYLAEDLGWRALSVTADQRVQCDDPRSQGNKTVQRKVRAAERDGMTVQMVKGEVSAELRAEVDAHIAAWQNSREGTQVHTTKLRPWADCQHRTYFIGREKNGKACGLISLAKLAPEHGYQIKWALAFPDSPQGTSEYLLYHVIGVMRDAGVHSATFGAGAKDSLEVVDNIKGIKAKLLSQMYQAIVSSFSLTNKTRYREKFGTFQDDLYVCYPDGSMGLSGIEAIMRSVKDPQAKKKKKRASANGADHDAASTPASTHGGASIQSARDSTAAKLNGIVGNTGDSVTLSKAAGGA
ncbi:aspartyl-tRNA synthetase cytoplasmic [Athelia psychrophila]|uniref:aspartate--tRNA ligase n=1 Tax=Athelia psychrophila TaxID=1759441 RepID=A0A167VRV5_9AGAM|nr:aspartyl-tRNA synthetase cytoplasmic [Fibularhizoctonia sp. CBS 109695]